MWPINYEFSYDITILQYVSITIHGKVIHGLFFFTVYRPVTITIYGSFLTTQLTTQYPFFDTLDKTKNILVNWRAERKRCQSGSSDPDWHVRSPARRRPLSGSSFSAHSTHCRLPLSRTLKKIEASAVICYSNVNFFHVLYPLKEKPFLWLIHPLSARFVKDTVLFFTFYHPFFNQISPPFWFFPHLRLIPLCTETEWSCGARVWRAWSSWAGGSILPFTTTRRPGKPHDPDSGSFLAGSGF